MARIVLFQLAAGAHALMLTTGPVHRSTAPAPRIAMAASDDDLWASLKARIAVTEEAGTAPPPLGVEDLGADVMGPTDVVEYVMKSIRADAEVGAKNLMSFAVRYDDGVQEDNLGQLQPGSFGAPAALVDYWRGHPRYAALADLDEWKCMGTPEFSNMSRNAAQKLLVSATARLSATSPHAPAGTASLPTLACLALLAHAPHFARRARCGGTGRTGRSSSSTWCWARRRASSASAGSSPASTSRGRRK